MHQVPAAWWYHNACLTVKRVRELDVIETARRGRTMDKQSTTFEKDPSDNSWPSSFQNEVGSTAQ